MARWRYSCAGTFGVEHQHDERIYNPSNPCRYNLTTHTYHFGRIFSINQISGGIVFGPANLAGSYYVTIYCEISTNGISWTSVGSKSGWSGPNTESFIFNLPGYTKCAHMRFRATGGYVDGSAGQVAGILYLRPKRVVPSVKQIDNQLRLRWTYELSGEDVQSVEIYKKDSDEGFLKIATVPEAVTEYYDSILLGENKYYLRTIGINGNYSEFSETDIVVYSDNMVQIEFGAGGDIMRHVIQSHHGGSSSGNDIIFKLWRKDSEVQNIANDIDMKMSGEEEIFIKNLLPFDDNSVFGDSINFWRNIFSKKTTTEESISAKLELWNGR